MTYDAHWFFIVTFLYARVIFVAITGQRGRARRKKSFFNTPYGIFYIYYYCVYCNKRAWCAWHILCFFLSTFLFKINYLIEFKLIQKHCDVWNHSNGRLDGPSLRLTNNNDCCSRHARIFCHYLKFNDIFVVFPW